MMSTSIPKVHPKIKHYQPMHGLIAINVMQMPRLASLKIQVTQITHSISLNSVKKVLNWTLLMMKQTMNKFGTVNPFVHYLSFMIPKAILNARHALTGASSV